MPPLETSRSLFDEVAQWLDGYQFGVCISERGHVVSVGDGIAWIKGLPSVAMDEVLLFEDGSRGVVYELTKELVGAVLLYESETLTAGTLVTLSHRAMSTPVGDALLGRVIDPLGEPLDGGPKLQANRWRTLELASPPIVERDFVHKSLYTGIKIVDTMIPIGKGQRQLIVGDEGLGRSSIAIDTVINQRGKAVYCIYVLIGQKRSTLVSTINLLREQSAMEYTTVVAAEGSGLPGLQYLAPFVGCSIAEYWMHQGRDTLVVYDDLSTHAKTYRELSLLLRRPPGREAYPGDIFSVHARLLERATCLNAENGGGSMTALPIVETQQGEIAAYIPTNLISITDGQIYLERELFVSGFRPAVDIARSVSRIGGQAQHQSIKAEAGRMKLDYLQFLELEVFTRFGAKLESTMEAAIKKGRLLREMLKQERLETHSIEFHLAWLIAFNDDLLIGLTVSEIAPALHKLADHVAQTTLTLDSPREQWQAMLRRCLGEKPEAGVA